MRLSVSRQHVLGLSLALLLTACSAASPPAAQTSPEDNPDTTIELPANPTVVPLPTASTAEAPTAISMTLQPSSDHMLPAPVYVRSGNGLSNQIKIIERDSHTVTQLTFEAQSVQDFDVATDTGTLVYLFGDDSQRTLVALDGSGRRELRSGQLSTPRVSPDGQTVIVRIDNPEQENAPSGVWALPLTGGEPRLVQADDPLSDESTLDGVAWTYTPVSYDQSGEHMLLSAYNMAGASIPGNDLVILNRNGDEVIRTSTCCEGATWSVDGTAITITGGGPGPDLRYGLYQINATTGEERAVIEPIEGMVPLVTGARQIRDGQIYTFYQELSDADFNWDYPFTPQMVRVSQDGTITSLRQDSYNINQALWRDDASGALIAAWDDQDDYDADGRLIWLDSSGGPAMKTELFGSLLHWADSERPLYEGDCSLLPQIGWQPSATRAFSAGAADLQARLNAQNINAGEADGYFGDQSRDALHQFQISRNIPPNDNLDCATWQALLGRP